jgi:uncharacterized protein (DUF58 family)
VRLASPTVAPMGTRRARQGLHEDPALFSGVRPFQLGDSRRRLHWRATARVGRPVSKRFDPSTVRETLIALDVQTTDAAYWVMVYEEELLESLMVAAASIARYLIGQGTACGLAAAAWTGSLKRIAFLPPAAGEAQLNAIADMLGRLSAFASTPFGFLLGTLPERVSPGTGILVLSGRDPTQHVAIERRLARNGSPVTHVALGERREAWAEIARRYGVEARTATLHGGWRTSDALDLAG